MENNKNKLKQKIITAAFLSLVVAGCSSLDKKSNNGGYYQDDGPGSKSIDLDSIPNATPRNEPYSQAASRPYRIRGQQYVPLSSAKGFVEAGQASWYGKKYHGRKTSIGEVYDMYAMTAAHKTLPIPSYARVTSVQTNKSIVVRVNDRGPFIGDRIIDLSYVAAQKLGVVSAGTGRVIVESITDSEGAAPQSRSQSTYPAQLGTSRNTPSYTEEQIDSQASNYVNTRVSPSNTPNPMSTSPSGNMLQVGAFSVAANAQRLKSKLLKEGFVYTSVEQRNSLYKVVLGPYTQNQLNSVSSSLKSAGYSVIVVGR